MSRRRFTRWILGIIGGLVLLLATSAIVVETPWFKERLRRIVVDRANEALAGRLRVGRLTGSLLTGVELHDVELTQGDGSVLKADRISVRYDPRLLARGNLTFDELTLTNPEINLVERPEGWNFARLAKPTERRGTTEIEFDKVTIVNGGLRVDPLRAEARQFQQVNSSLALSYSAQGLDLDVESLALQDVDTGWHLRGGTASVTTQQGDLQAALDFETSAGTIAGTLSGATDDQGRHLHGEFDVRDLDLAPVAAREDLASDITGQVRVDATVPPSASVGPTVSFQIDAPEVSALGYSAQNVRGTGSYQRGVLNFDVAASAYGAETTARGVWRTAEAAPASGALQLSGRVRGLDIRRLPPSFQAPPLDSRVAGRYDFSYRPGGWEVTLRLENSSLEGAELGAGAVARAEMHAGVPSYSFQGRIAGLNLRRVAGPLGIDVLEQERFESEITGDVRASGRGQSLDRLVLDAEATLTDSSIGALDLSSAAIGAHLESGRLAVDFSGPFAHLTDELLGLGGTSIDLTGTATGLRVQFDDVRGPIELNTLDAAGRVTLRDSVLAGYDVAQAEIDAVLADGTAAIRDLRVDGSELQATAAGTVAFSGDAASNLTFTVDAQSLEAAATRVDQPLAGAAHVEGTISGPPDQMVAEGTMALRQFQYGTTVDALSLNGTFSLEVSDQQWSDAIVRTELTGTFMELAGLEVQQMTASATYRDRTLDVDTRIEQPDRTIELGGLLLLHPDHQEVHLRQLAVTTADQVWALPQGQEAVVNYGGDVIEIDDLMLTRGVQRIGVSGALAAEPGGQARLPGIDVTFEHVQLADINQLMAGTREITGVLNGRAELRGTTSDPVVDSTLTVTEGAVEGTAFQSFSAEAAYRNGELALDARLTMQPGAELIAEGVLPITIGAAEPAGERRIDLRVESAPIDLGIFQALTTHLTQLTGTGEFDVRVTGTPEAPRVDGRVAIANASFTVPPTGVSYTGGVARVQFDGDRVRIDEFVLNDDDGQSIRIEGGAEVEGGRALRALDLRIVSEEITLMRNPMGAFELEMDLRATGTPARFALTGEATLEGARFEVDELIERFASSAYSTEAAQPVAEPVRQAAAEISPEEESAPEPAAPEVEQGPSGTPLQNATIDVTLNMPDDVVLRADDLRTAPGSTALGSTNLTVGGTLNLRKEPDSPVMVVGGVDVVRGFYEFQGRRFEIVRGSAVEFRGNQPIDPTLNITASREISGVTTQVGVQGTLRQPRLELSSYPPLDQSDILSLIIFGQPVNTLGGSQRVDLAQRAGNLALGAIAGPLAESVGEALNLDLFEIRTQGESGSAEVALGAQIGSRLYVGLRQEFGRDDASVVSFEYRISELLRLVTSIAQGVQQTHATRRTDPTGLDLIFLMRY